MKWLTNFFSTSVGQKQLMALSGLGLGVFLVMHLSGNLLLFVPDGGESFNAYAEFLTSQIWINPARAGLVATFGLHIYLAFNLSGTNRKARGGQDYFYKSDSTATFASRHMLLTGIMIMAFLVFHLIHFTWADKSGPGGLYGLVRERFTDPMGGGFYILCMIILGVHLVHAIQSVFQTFGLRHKKYTLILKYAAMAGAIGLSVGFASIPIWFLISKGGMS